MRGNHLHNKGQHLLDRQIEPDQGAGIRSLARELAAEYLDEHDALVGEIALKRGF